MGGRTLRRSRLWWRRLKKPISHQPSAINDHQRRRRRWPWLSLGLLALALIAVGAFALTRPDKVDVPNVEGRSLLEARDILERRGFEEVDVERVRSPAERDTVLDQDPNAGESAATDEAVTLEVSNGPGEARVPSVKNLLQEQAVNDLNQIGFKVNVETEPSDTVKKGFAIRTVPKEGSVFELGQRVTLFVSSGPELVEVPDVVGLSRDSAENRLTQEGFDVAVREQEDEAREDEVIEQDPIGRHRDTTRRDRDHHRLEWRRAGRRAERDRPLAVRCELGCSAGRA